MGNEHISTGTWDTESSWESWAQVPRWAGFSRALTFLAERYGLRLTLNTDNGFLLTFVNFRVEGNTVAVHRFRADYGRAVWRYQNWL